MTDFSESLRQTPRARAAETFTKEGQAQLFQAQAAEKQMQVATMQRVQKAMQDMAAGQGVNPDSVPVGEDPAAMLNFGAQLYAREGDFETAGKLATESSSILSQRATERHQALTAVKAAQDIADTNLAKLEGLLRDSTPDNWKERNVRYGMITGEQSPYLGQPYNKAAIDSLTNQVLTAQAKLTLDTQRAEAASRDTARRERTAFNKAKLGIAREELRVRQDRDKRLAKLGGKDIGSPSGQEVNIVYPLVAKAMPDLEPEEILEKSNAVASHARMLRKTNPGMTNDKAVQMALQQVSRIPGITYQDGKTPNGALPLPTKRADVQIGHWYNTTAGVRKWNGAGFEAQPSVLDADFEDTALEEE